MLYLEDNLHLDDHIIINKLSLANYSNKDLIYTTYKLEEANYLNCSKFSADDDTTVFVNSITFQGHQFLDNIRDDSIWNNSKKILSCILIEGR